MPALHEPVLAFLAERRILIGEDTANRLQFALPQFPGECGVGYIQWFPAPYFSMHLITIPVSDRSLLEGISDPDIRGLRFEHVPLPGGKLIAAELQAVFGEFPRNAEDVRRLLGPLFDTAEAYALAISVRAGRITVH